MKIVTAIDSFKGSMTSMEAGRAVAEGIHRADAGAEVLVRPLADGGEGMVEALTSGMNGSRQQVQVTGPLGTPVICEYGIIEASGTAVIEMAGAAGITLVPDEKRNPLYTTTYGVGEVIRDAIKKGCRRFIIGIGGSATNDGGTGMLQALGYGFLDKNGNQIPFGARGLKVLETITETHVLQELKECRFRIACDVTNSLCGEPGVQCCLWSAERGNSVHGCGDGSMAGKLCGTGRKKIPESRSAAGRNRGSRRTGICISDIYRCSFRVRDQDCFRRNPAGRVHQRSRLGDYRRRTDGRTDRHGESTDRSSRTCKEIRKDCDRIYRGSRSGCRKMQ